MKKFIQLLFVIVQMGFAMVSVAQENNATD